MLISTKGRYALRVMVELAGFEKEVYVPLKQIADRQNISEKYLESILVILTKAGMIDGLRGRNGGYRLNRDASQYHMGEILRLTEPSLAPVACLSCGSNPCENASSCKTLPMWKKLQTLIGEYLDSVSLADLLEPGSPKFLE